MVLENCFYVNPNIRLRSSAFGPPGAQRWPPYRPTRNRRRFVPRKLFQNNKHMARCATLKYSGDQKGRFSDLILVLISAKKQKEWRSDAQKRVSDWICKLTSKKSFLASPLTPALVRYIALTDNRLIVVRYLLRGRSSAAIAQPTVMVETWKKHV